MAAEQIPGRICACGCGGSLDGLPRQTQRLPDCQREHRIKSRRDRMRNVHGVQNKVFRRSEADLAADPPRERVPVCKVCCGLPWARVPERWGDDGPGGLGDPIVGDNGLCRGCNEPYAPEPPPERLEPIGSSAGTLARHGTLYGVEITMGSYDCAQKRAREAVRNKSRNKYG